MLGNSSVKENINYYRVVSLDIKSRASLDCLHCHNVIVQWRRLTSEYVLLATRTEQDAEDSGSPTKTPGSESRFSEYLTITTLDVTPDDSKSNSFARGQHVCAQKVVGIASSSG